MNVDRALQRLWYEGRYRWLLGVLLPLSLLFAGMVRLRRACYRAGLLRAVRVERPVIVVGNITVGGTGKTPFVAWLAHALRGRGYKPAIVLRGYRGNELGRPRDVFDTTPTDEAGDEAVLLARRTGAIVVAGVDRAAAAQRAIERGADVVIADDGLQHYRLARDCEVAVVDEERMFGNSLSLPAGPLREPRSRLAQADLVVLTRRGDSAGSAAMPLSRPQVIVRSRLGEAVSLSTAERRALDVFRGRAVHAVAGIGNPEAFFAALRAAGLQVEGRALPDHARITPQDIEFAGDAPVLMTEKDAIKCRTMAGPRHWAVPMEIEISQEDEARVLAVVERAISFNRVGCDGA